MNVQDTQLASGEKRAKAPLRRTDRGAAAVGAGAASQPAALASPTAQPDSRLESPPSYVEPGQRRAMIAEAAYYLAERRGFEPGRELEDWCLAEGEIDGRLNGAETPEVCGVPDLA